MKKRDLTLEKNQAMTTIADFLDAYNKSAPEGFPRATLASLKKFQTTNPKIFKDGNQWSIEKHRKKLMDWLLSYHDA